MTLLIQLIGISMLIGSSIQLSTPESPTYVAGVVEYLVNQGISGGTPSENYQRNADKYIEIIKSPEATNIDIIVFPEACLNSRETAVIVPLETEDIDLCANATYEQNFRNLACAARDLRKYIVVNLYMKRNCTEEHENELHEGHEHECTSDWTLYNTNVVLDRAGKVISIYRKYNLFGEPGITPPSTPDISTFETDFGVTFGHFICFDLMFQEPALKLVADGIKDIVFPTMWFSELPFLSAVQIQQNWAQSNDVNFLGAGANQPTVGSSGTGIYSGESGSLISIMTGEETTRLLVHEVPKIPGHSVQQSSPAYSGSNFDNLKLKRDQLDNYEFKKIEVPESTTTPLHDEFTLCQKLEDDELCCDFEIDVALQTVPENSVSYTYYSVAFNGIRTFDGVANGFMKTCAILACLNESISTCGVMYDSNQSLQSKISFENIVISGSFPRENVFTLPNTLNFNVSPYATADFSYEEITTAQSTKDITISLLTPKTDLFTFAIYGRDFRTSSGNRITSAIIVLLTPFVFKFLIA